MNWQPESLPRELAVPLRGYWSDRSLSGPTSLLGNAEMRLLKGFRGRLSSGVLIGSVLAGVPLAQLPNTGSQPAVVADFRFHPAVCGALCEGDNGARLRQPDREVAPAAASATIQKRAHAGD